MGPSWWINLWVEEMGAAISEPGQDMAQCITRERWNMESSVERQSDLQQWDWQQWWEQQNSQQVEQGKFCKQQQKEQQQQQRQQKLP
jgi:hypothetical protein